MIQYTTGEWSVKFLFAREGSVFPKALVWAVPAALHTLLVHSMLHYWSVIPRWDTGSGVGAIWSSFTFVLGFLLVFRTQSAYARYWEGAHMVQESRANLFNACSSVVAFCSIDRANAKRVEEFQHLLVRLMSMLHCVGLQTIAEMSDVKFEFFNTYGMDQESMKFLSRHTDRQQRCEIVVQWIQRLVVEASKNGIIDVPAPILTRFFQELSQGATHIINARIITGIPFPFPYAQLLTTLLIAHWLLTPWFCAVVMNSAALSATITFTSVVAFWGVNYIAAEIESPFGNDANDLPLHALQKDMNKSLWILLHPHTQTVPLFEFDPAMHRKWDVVTKANFGRATDHNKSIFLGPPSKIWTQRCTASFIDPDADADAGQDELPCTSVASLSLEMSRINPNARSVSQCSSLPARSGVGDRCLSQISARTVFAKSSSSLYPSEKPSFSEHSFDVPDPRHTDLHECETIREMTLPQEFSAEAGCDQCGHDTELPRTGPLSLIL